MSYNLAHISTYTNYYPFGMQMPGRSSNSEEYRYGFNGKEKDDEIKGNGNHLDFGARCYDSRLAKFLSLDPDAHKYPFMSPYCYAGNTPIQAIDANGEGPIVVVQSLTSSQTIKSYIKQYKAGDITYKEFYGKVSEYMRLPFKSKSNEQFAQNKYNKSGLGNLRWTGSMIDDPEYNSHTLTPVASAAYRDGYKDDDVLYLTLIEEGKDGNWKQSPMEIEAPRYYYKKNYFGDGGTFPVTKAEIENSSYKPTRADNYKSFKEGLVELGPSFIFEKMFGKLAASIDPASFAASSNRSWDKKIRGTLKEKGPGSYFIRDMVNFTTDGGIEKVGEMKYIYHGNNSFTVETKKFTKEEKFQNKEMQ